jgi:hypothetical protein
METKPVGRRRSEKMHVYDDAVRAGYYTPPLHWLGCEQKICISLIAEKPW